MEKRKRVPLIFLATLLASACHPHIKKDVEVSVKGQPAIQFETTEHHFDTVQFKGDASYNFEFANVGDQPLLITNVRTSCGCTVSKYSKKPYQSKEGGFIEVEYDTGRMGRFTKTITVYTNAREKPYVLRIDGFVKD